MHVRYEQPSLIQVTRPMLDHEYRRPRPRRKPRQAPGAGHHTNSLTAHRQITPTLTGRRAQVLDFLRHHGPATDRQIMRGLGFSDPNAVRPRITELLDMGLITQAGTTTDPTTHMQVRLIKGCNHAN